MEKMLKAVEWCKIMKHKHFNKDMILTEDDERNFRKADKCYICNKNYSAKDVRVRDHCHITGKYRGSAHQNCNTNCRLTDKIPVIFHNLNGYDSHVIMQKIGKIANKHRYKNKKGEVKQIIWKIHGFHTWKTFGFYRQPSVHEFKSRQINK